MKDTEVSTPAKANAFGATKGTARLTMRTPKAATVAAAMAALSIMSASPGHAQTDAAAVGPLPADAPPPVRNALSEGVAAIVNDEIISTYDLGQRVLLLLVTTGVRPTQQNMPQIEAQALASLTDERLETEEIRKQEKAQKFTIMADDAEVNDNLKRIAQGNNTTADQLLKSLASAGVQSQTLREQLRAQISWSHWIQGRYGGSRIKIGEDQINEVLRQIQAQAEQPQYQLSEIFIDAARVGGIDAATTGAQQLVAQLQQGAPFAAVARQFSAASTAANGGDAGWLTTVELPAELRDAVAELRPGQLSRPIVTQTGVYIVFLRDKRSGAGEELVSLKQAAIGLTASASDADVAAATAKLVALRAQITGCDMLETTAAKVDGVIAGDLGEANVKDLRPSFRDAVSSLKVGQVSEPIRTEAGLHLIALCGQRRSGATIPSREEIQDRLEDQQLSLVSRRYLRDLRNSATIETR
jgi:peptidyl-prolyl cis-trans isomerase SurA